MLLSLALAALISQPANDAIIPVPIVADWWVKRHEAMVARAAQGNVDLVFIGDSITHAFGGEPDTGEFFHNRGKDTWDWFYGDRRALNLGISGDRTQHVLWRLNNGEMDGIKPKVIEIMIGTNNVASNSADQIAEGVEAVCLDAHQKAPKAKELLLAIFPRDSADSQSRAKIADTNKVLEPWAKTNHITFLDIGQVFLDSKGEIPVEIMPDHLHPTALGYRKWAMATEPTLAKLMRQRPKTKDDPQISTLVPVTQNRDYPAYDWMPRHERILGEIKDDPSAELVFIGDSITHHFGEKNSDPKLTHGQEVWDEFYGKRNVINEGYGYDRIENVLWRIQQGELDGIHPKAIVILIGTNNLQVNTPDEIRQGMQALLRDVHARQPHAHVLLLGIFPRAKNPEDPLRLKAQEVNQLLATMRKPRGVKYQEIWSQFIAQDGTISTDFMSDFVHPTSQGYRIEAEAIEPILDDWLGKREP